MAKADPPKPKAKGTDPMQPGSSSTTPDDVPPVHVLEAMQAQDRKETEDLLSGFDRPGRTPRQPAANRDFVDYHLHRERRAREPSPPRERQRSAHDISTVIVPRKSPLSAPWLPWVGVALVVVALAILVGLVFTSAPPPKTASTIPSATTTITAATASAPEPSNHDPRTNELPPPPQETAPTVITATASAPSPAKREPKTPSVAPAETTLTPPSPSPLPPTTAPTATMTATATSLPPPAPSKPGREDFVRDL